MSSLIPPTSTTFDPPDRLRALEEECAVQAARIGRLEQELSGTQSTLVATYVTRDSLGRTLRSFLGSWVWTLAKPGWMLARALGKLRVGIHQLVPLTGAQRESNGTLSGVGYAQFVVPIVPLKGWVRLRTRIRCTFPSRACLYFDTGSAFHPHEHYDLGVVEGETTIDRLVPLARETFLIRFDAIQNRSRFSVEEFSLEPRSMLTANLGAVATNCRKFVRDPASRPAIRLALRYLFTGKLKQFHGQLIDNVTTITSISEYDYWCKRHQITEQDRQRMRQEMAGWKNPPKFSVILPVYNVAEVFLRSCIDSVINQIYPHWELCIADDASPALHVKRVLQLYAGRDNRIKVVYRQNNGNISAASNSAFELATAPYTALLDHDDELTEHALFKMAQALVKDPSVEMIYSDEDKLTPTGRRYDPFFKPDWSPEYFLACMYTCHLGVYRTDLIKKVGGWRSEFDSSQDYDLVLRIIATRPKILHIPDILYHWRAIPSSAASDHSAKPEAPMRAARAIQRYITAMGREGHVEPGPSPGYHRVRYDIKGNPRVSIIIPSACRPVEFRGRQTWFVLECVNSIRRQTTYENIEIFIVDDGEISPDLESALAPLEVTRLSYDKPFNFSHKINLAAEHATGEHLLLLNDDVEVITPDWIQSLLEFSQWPEIGIVGAQLLFPDNTLQHSGVTLLEGAPGHPFYRYPADHPGYFNSAQVHRNWSAVTAACLMTRADVFHDVGGFDDKFPINYGDADYCLKVISAGKRIVYMPYAKLYHHESATKSGTYEHELTAFKEVWLPKFPVDPYYNPNLTTRTGDFTVA